MDNNLSNTHESKGEFLYNLEKEDIEVLEKEAVNDEETRMLLGKMAYVGTKNFQKNLSKSVKLFLKVAKNEKSEFKNEAIDFLKKIIDTDLEDKILNKEKAWILSQNI